MRRAGAWLLAATTGCGLAATSGPAAAAPKNGAGPTLTVLEGTAWLIRGTSRYPAAAGLRLLPGDVIEPGDGSWAELEHGNGCAVGLGPASRALLVTASGTRRSGAPLEVFLLAGTAKASVAAGAPGVALWGPLFAVSVKAATVVVETDAAGAALFAETGDARVEEGPTASLVRSGSFWTRAAGRKPGVAERPSRTFIDRLPPPFLDPLPSRVARFAGGAEVRLTRPAAFTYAEVQAWLTTVAPIRALLAERWRTKAEDPAFRKALIDHLASHPEWRPILFPEAKPAAAAPGGEGRART